MTNYEMVREFHDRFNVEEGIEYPNLRTRALREELIKEEFSELQDAMDVNDRVLVADALADLLYVVYGTAAVYGLPIDRVFAEVHRSNMSKLGEDGQPIYREDGKVLKGPNYSPPSIKELL